jgi:hypothetical protein
VLPNAGFVFSTASKNTNEHAQLYDTLFISAGYAGGHRPKKTAGIG